MADDVRQLADSLGIERFLVAGFSGGGPHALAVAHGLPDRVIAAGSISGAGPIDTRDALKDMSRANRLIFTLARTAPALLRPVVAQHAHSMKRHPANVLDSAARDRSLPEADREAMTTPRLRGLMITAAPEAFRQGVRGVVHEARICAQPWGFDPAAIKLPVCIWHGDQDANVPVAMARLLAARIPDSSLTIYRSEGHLIVPRHWDEILAALLSGYPQSAKAARRPGSSSNRALYAVPAGCSAATGRRSGREDATRRCARCRPARSRRHEARSAGGQQDR